MCRTFAGERNRFGTHLLWGNVAMPSETFLRHLHSVDYIISMFEFYFRQGPAAAHG
jgi:hypothetical protein